MSILFTPFCTFFLDDCHSQLVLRREILWMVRQDRYKLRLTYGVGSFPDGSIWDVQLELKRDSHNVIACCTFTDGWKKFAQDVCLTAGDTIVFKLVEQNLMSVEFFNEHGLLKEAPLPMENTSSAKEEEVSSDDSSRLGNVIGGHNRGRECNIIVNAKKSSCTIPQMFAMYNGLGCLSEVEIEDPAETRWTVEVEIAPPKHRFNHQPVRQRPERFRWIFTSRTK